MGGVATDKGGRSNSTLDRNVECNFFSIGLGVRNYHTVLWLSENNEIKLEEDS
jgi:hypothetical protein